MRESKKVTAERISRQVIANAAGFVAKGYSTEITDRVIIDTAAEMGFTYGTHYTISTVRKEIKATAHWSGVYELINFTPAPVRTEISDFSDIFNF